MGVLAPNEWQLTIEFFNARNELAAGKETERKQDGVLHWLPLKAISSN